MSTARLLAAVALAVPVLVSLGGSPVSASATPTPCSSTPTDRFPARRRVVPILMYHRINVVTATTPAASRPLTVHPDVFERQLRWLARNGYRTITQHELLGALRCGTGLGPRPVMITLDDGYRDTFFRAAPVLTRLGMRATAYVVSGRISAGDPSFLTWPLLKALERRGIEIGSHTTAHRDLTRLSPRDLAADLLGSRLALERRLGHPVPWLAYPFGAFDARVARAARQAGYLLAVTTAEGTLQSSREPLALRRLRILDTTGVAGLAALLGG